MEQLNSIGTVRSISRLRARAARFVVLVTISGNLALLSSGSAVAQQFEPVPIDSVLSSLQWGILSPLELSPDGQYVALTMLDPLRLDEENEHTSDLYNARGVPAQFVGGDVWIVEVETGESHRITGGIGSSWGATWSGDSRFIAFLSDRTGTAALWIWDVQSRELRQASTKPVRFYYGFDRPVWLPNDREVAVKFTPDERAATEDGSGVNVLRVADGGRPDVVVFESPLDVTRQSTASSIAMYGLDRYLSDIAVVDVFTGETRIIAERVTPIAMWASPRGDVIAYMSIRPRQSATTQQNRYDLQLAHLDGAPPTMLAEGVPTTYGMSVSWSPDGSRIAYTTDGPQAGGECYVVDVDARTVVQIVPGRGGFDRRWAAPLWDSNGRELYLLARDTIWRAPADGDSLLAIAAIPGRQLTHILRDRKRSEVWMPDTEPSLYVSTRDPLTLRVGFARVYTRSGEWEQLVEEAAYHGTDFPFRQDVTGSTIVWAAESASQPRALWVADQSFENRRRLAAFTRVADRYLMGESRLVEWQGRNGERLRGALLLPAGHTEGSRHPLIVRVYGGDLLSTTLNLFGLSQSNAHNHQVFATRGYAVLLPDAPLRRGTPLSDLESTVVPGIEHLISIGLVDSTRVGEMGESYGGYSTLALVTQSRLFRAAVSVAGFSNLITMYGRLTRSGNAAGIAWAEEGQARMPGDPWAHLTAYIQNSPHFYLDRVTAPILIIQGGADRESNPFPADETFVALRRLGKRAAYAKYEGEGHYPERWRYRNARDFVLRVLDWFDEHLVDQSGPSSSSTRPWLERAELFGAADEITNRTAVEDNDLRLLLGRSLMLGARWRN